MFGCNSVVSRKIFKVCFGLLFSFKVFVNVILMLVLVGFKWLVLYNVLLVMLRLFRCVCVMLVFISARERRKGFGSVRVEYLYVSVDFFYFLSMVYVWLSVNSIVGCDLFKFLFWSVVVMLLLLWVVCSNKFIVCALLFSARFFVVVFINFKIFGDIVMFLLFRFWFVVILCVILVSVFILSVFWVNVVDSVRFCVSVYAFDVS